MEEIHSLIRIAGWVLLFALVSAAVAFGGRILRWLHEGENNPVEGDETIPALSNALKFAQRDSRFSRMLSCIPSDEQVALASTAEGRDTLGALITWASTAATVTEDPEVATATIVHSWHRWADRLST